MRLEIELFSFDYKHDYLPYYTKHFLKISNEITLLDILNTINEDKKFSYEKRKDFLLCINGLYTKADVLIKDIVLKIGKDLVIEPLSIRRSHKDLLINDDDFQNKFNILKDFMPKKVLPSYQYNEIKELYQSYKIYFYASNTINIEKNYIGDSLLLLASFLIKTYPQAEKYILNKIKEEKISASYHTDLSSRLFDYDENIEKEILFIQNKLNILSEASIHIKNKIDFPKINLDKKVLFDFKGFKTLYYCANKKNEKTLSLLNTLEIKQLNLSSRNNDLALNTFNENKNFTYKLAAEIILDAYDQGADFLLVDTIEHFYLFDNNISFLEKISNRDIVLPVLYINELYSLAQGEHKEIKKALDKHVIKIDLLEKEES